LKKLGDIRFAQENELKSMLEESKFNPVIQRRALYEFMTMKAIFDDTYKKLKLCRPEEIHQQPEDLTLSSSYKTKHCKSAMKDKSSFPFDEVSSGLEDCVHVKS